MNAQDFEVLTKFYSKLIDKESKEIFAKRVSFLFNRDSGKFYNALFDESKKYRCTELFSFLEQKEYRGLMIYGAGQIGLYTYRLLKCLDLSVVGFVDADPKKQLMGMCDLPVIAPEMVAHEYKDCIVILAAVKWKAIFYERLVKCGFPQENIFWPRGQRLDAYCGKQYFDLPELPHVDNEIFLDGGCLNMGDSISFINWCGGNYKKIYAFEPDPFSAKSCKGFIDGKGLNDKVELVQAGMWSKDDLLGFSSGLEGGSSISNNGNIEIPVRSIDSVLDGEPATFIKLDIEGAELEALKGAIKTIGEYYPKLAISIYHKPMDVIDIPIFLMNNFPEYKYAIRHYSSSSIETILYAFR